jgi:hypothetical protein
VETLRQGDHLQLLYHFQLVGQMVRREIPLFANPYEFNLGEDRRVLDPYYVPFSLEFALFEPLVGTAAAWNLAQLTSVLIGAALLFLLARRWGGDGAAVLATLVALCVPYRWETLAGGSPTGFGMAWVPGVALGVDILVRDGRRRGGLLAGAMLLLCYTTDLHCFLFGLLLLPFWYVVAWLGRGRGVLWPTRAEFRRVAVATLPLAAFVVASGLIALRLRAQYAATDAAGGRAIRDLVSPYPQGILDPRSTLFMANQVYLGWGIVLLVAAASVAAAAAVCVRGVRESESPRVRESESPRIRESESPRVRESESPRVRGAEERGAHFWKVRQDHRRGTQDAGNAQKDRHHADFRD